MHLPEPSGHMRRSPRGLHGARTKHGVAGRLEELQSRLMHRGGRQQAVFPSYGVTTGHRHRR